MVRPFALRCPPTSSRAAPSLSRPRPPPCQPGREAGAEAPSLPPPPPPPPPGHASHLVSSARTRPRPRRRLQSVVEDTLARISDVGGVEGYVISDERVRVCVAWVGGALRGEARGARRGEREARHPASRARARARTHKRCHRRHSTQGVPFRFSKSLSQEEAAVCASEMAKLVTQARHGECFGLWGGGRGGRGGGGVGGRRLGRGQAAGSRSTASRGSPAAPCPEAVGGALECCLPHILFEW